MTALLAVALAVTVIRGLGLRRARVVLAAVAGLAAAMAAACGYGPALAAVAVIAGAGTCAAVVLLHPLVVVTVPRWVARAGGAS
jgi:hypothetical protein